MQQKPHTTAESIEREVRANVLAQRVGAGTVADLDLPHEFVTRLTDRALRASFVERFRAVVEDGAGAVPVPAHSPGGAHAEGGPGDGPSLNRITTLARDGLIPTLCRLLKPIGDLDAGGLMDALNAASFPVDLLSSFTAPGVDGPSAVAAHVAERVRRGESAAQVARSLSFTPRPTLPGFRAVSDSGGATLERLRVQWPTHGHYLGPGDGSCPDLLRAAMAALPGVPVDVLSHAAPGGLPTGARWVEQSPAPTQWARDNAICGWAGEPGGGGPAHLAPRFATVREATSDYLAADDRAVAVGGTAAARSPLLFQGGNILIYDDSARGQRVMLIGEAEIARNRALGLTAEQVAALFRAECGVDRVAALPAASYHIDQEVSVRSPGGAGRAGLAFVPDVHHAAMLVVASLLPMLSDGPGAAAQDAIRALGANEVRAALERVWEVIMPHQLPGGGWPLAFAHRLRAHERDNGVAHFRRFLAALDELTALCTVPEELPDPFARAFLRSLKRRARDRAAIRAVLTSLGLVVEGVPAMPDDARGVNPLNMVHAPGIVLVPVVGGALSPVDDAACGVIQRLIGPHVRVQPIPSGESQCRDGGVRCSLAVYGHPSR